MATANGVLTPPTASEPPATAATPSDTSTNKRKREDEPTSQPRPNTTEASPKRTQTQRDILEILQQYDTQPSFLQYDFEDSSTGSSEPSHKKARLSDGSNKTNMRAKLDNGSYPALQSLKEDAARVSKAVETSLRAKAREREGLDVGRLSVDDLKQIQRTKAFEALIGEMVDKESQYEVTHGSKAVKKEAVGLVNGHASDTKGSANNRVGTVLTLFGNAPTPKQLFSSMHSSTSEKQHTLIKSELPIEEMSLPNGLTATKLMPAPVDDRKKGPTFEEAFAPPYNLPSLHPPKAHKRSTTRDNTITWEFKDPISRGSKKGGYAVQSLTAGDWLGYGGIETDHDAASAKEKRKQRDRALSSGAESTNEPPSKTSLEDAQAKEEEALFRRAYGSFAPSVDNARSVIPAETKGMIWWQKVGEKRFTETFAIDPALLDDSSVDAAKPFPALGTVVDEDENFEQAVKDLDGLDEEMANVQPVTSKTDVEQVLREVSELLVTLASHQRIRNASLAGSAVASRTPISPAPLLASRIGKPDEPAEDEVSTYHALRRELAYLILKLPPYAVAKIDGDQLADLGVSKLVPFESKDFKGTMEEDQVARLAKYNAMATAAGIATLTRGGSSSSGQHYNTTAQRTPAIGQAANTRYGQTSQYGTSRTPATQPQLQRATSGQATYNTPTATAPRPGYGQPTSQYTRPGAPQSSHAQPNGQPQYYPQRTPAPSGGYAGYNQQYGQSTPQTQPRPTYSTSQPLAQYQQRSHAAAAANATAYQTNSAASPAPGATNAYPRTASPATTATTAKPTTGYPAQPPTPQPQPQPPVNVQPRPAYQMQQQYASQQQQLPGSGRATPTYLSQPQTPVNGFRPPPPPPSALAVAPRGGSGTPQPLPAAAQQLAQQVQAQVRANGHG